MCVCVCVGVCVCVCVFVDVRSFTFYETLGGDISMQSSSGAHHENGPVVGESRIGPTDLSESSAMHTADEQITG